MIANMIFELLWDVFGPFYWVISACVFLTSSYYHIWKEVKKAHSADLWQRQG